MAENQENQKNDSMFEKERKKLVKKLKGQLKELQRQKKEYTKIKKKIYKGHFSERGCLVHIRACGRSACPRNYGELAARRPCSIDSLDFELCTSLSSPCFRRERSLE